MHIKHFLLLHSIMRCVTMSSPIKRLLYFTEVASKAYVKLSENIYGETFLSYNTHCILHLVNDVRNFGAVDEWSAFDYENNMTFYRKSCRKPNQQLQQIMRRASEKNAFPEKINKFLTQNHVVKVYKKHMNGPLLHSMSNCIQYKRIVGFHLDLSQKKKDNCIILHNGKICIIDNIILFNNSYFVLVRYFQTIENFFDVGIKSSEIGVYKCSEFISKNRSSFIFSH